MKQFEEFKLDTANQCLWQKQQQLTLPPKPFAVLRYLVENPGRLITHDELLDALWPETYVQPQVLRTYMLDLRKVLKDDASKPRFIQTLPKRGYCFLASVTESADPARSSPSQPAQQLIAGRDQELATLAEQFRLASSGQRRIVFIAGEAGIGKSALIDACTQQLSAVVATGQCVEGFGSKEEYYPIMEALSHLCASPEGDRVCKVLSRMAPAWLAALGRACEPAASIQSTQRMPGDLCAAFEELADLTTAKPLVLIFEDLQWADDASLHLLSALARRRAAAKLLILATCRPRPHHAGEAAEHPLKALKQDLLLRRLCTEIHLRPLSRAAVTQIISRQLNQPGLPSGLATFVHQRAEGNPLFVIAILEHLTATQDLSRFEKNIEAGIPDGLAQMIELEIDRLTQPEQRLLEAASLFPVAFPTWAVAAALDEDLADTEEACEALARRLYFVHRAGQDELPDGSCSAFYVFAHELYREVLSQRQTPTRRARRHIRIAERLATLFAEREASVAREIAMHFEAAGDWRRAIPSLRTAAVHADQRHSHAESIEILEHALRIALNLSDIERKPVERELHALLDRFRTGSTTASKSARKA
jgi:predicted ATPase